MENKGLIQTGVRPTRWRFIARAEGAADDVMDPRRQASAGN